MPFSNPDPLRYLGPTADPAESGGTGAPRGTDTTAATAWLHAQPWYAQTLASWGNPKTLSLGQRGYLQRMALQSGIDPSIGVNPHGDMEVIDGPMAQILRDAAFTMAAYGGGHAITGALTGGGGAATTTGASASPTIEQSMNAGDNATTTGIPPQFGQPAVDTVNSPAPNPYVNALKSLNPAGSPSNLIKTLTLLGSMGLSKTIGDQSAKNAVPQSLTDMLDLMNTRAKAQNPLFNAVNSGMYQMLPTYAKTGGPPTAV